MANRATTDYGQWHQQLLPAVIKNTEENVHIRVKALGRIIDDNLPANFAKFDVFENLRSDLPELITKEVSEYTTVQTQACKQLDTLQDYKKVGRNRLNRHKPKFLGDVIFADLFDKLYMHLLCKTDYNLQDTKTITIFLTILSETFDTMVSFPQAKPQPLILHKILVDDNAFKKACESLLTYYGIPSTQWMTQRRRRSSPTSTSNAKEAYDKIVKSLRSIKDNKNILAQKKQIPLYFVSVPDTPKKKTTTESDPIPDTGLGARSASMSEDLSLCRQQSAESMNLPICDSQLFGDDFKYVDDTFDNDLLLSPVPIHWDRAANISPLGNDLFFNETATFAPNTQLDINFDQKHNGNGNCDHIGNGNLNTNDNHTESVTATSVHMIDGGQNFVSVPVDDANHNHVGVNHTWNERPLTPIQYAPNTNIMQPTNVPPNFAADMQPNVPLNAPTFMSNPQNYHTMHSHINSNAYVYNHAPVHQSSYRSEMYRYSPMAVYNNSHLQPQPQLQQQQEQYLPPVSVPGNAYAYCNGLPPPPTPLPYGYTCCPYPYCCPPN